MKKWRLSLLAMLLSVLIFSCKKDNNPGTPTGPTVTTTGVYALNQGNYGQNNTTLTLYDSATTTATTDFFKNVNGFGLGDTGSDFIIYGGKIYIVMNNSGYVAVANSSTAKFIDTIDFKNSGVNRGPENIVAAGGKVFVSSTDNSVTVIDTTDMTITKVIPVGSNPAQMVIVGNDLYVSNTGGFSPSYDSTVSVIDLTALTEIKKITVGINPGSIAADSSGNIYVACTGDYNAIAPTLVKANTTSNSIVLTASIAAGTVRYINNTLLITGGYLGTPSVGLLSTTDLTAIRQSFVADGTPIVNPYGLDIDTNTGDVYVGDAKDYVSSGEIFCFDKNGNKKFSFSTAPGISPIKTGVIRH
jgi:YVTN family beta-propeller protein